MGVKWWGEGAYERQTIDGSQTAAKTLSLVREGDLIINKIWVRHGSTAIASRAVDGCAASGEFPTFELDRSRVEPRWLHWLTKTRGFWQKCDALSQGTSGKNRIKPTLFLTIEVPLPPLQEQRRIVARIEELAGKVEEARGLRRQAVEEAEVISSFVAKEAWDKSLQSASIYRLGQVAAVIDPQPDHRTPPEFPDGLPYVSIANITKDGQVDTFTARKVSPDVITQQEQAFKLATGDIVLGKIGTIGDARPIIVTSRFALSANVVLVKPYRNTISEKLMLHILRSPQVAEQFAEGTRKTAQQAFGIKKMREIRVPITPLDKQTRLLHHLDELQDKVDALKRLQAETARELNALLPSVLDKAFRGEL